MESKKENHQLCRPVVPPEVSSLMEEKAADSTKDDQSIHKQDIDSHKLFTGRRVLICVCIFAVLAVMVTTLALVFAPVTVTSISKRTRNHTESGKAHMQKGDPIGLPENGIKVFGHGDIVMNLFPHETVHPWILGSNHGNFSLQAERYIIVRLAGRYKIFCKVIFDRKPSKLKLSITRSGGSFLYGTALQSVGETPISILEEDVHLQENDCLSVITENQAAAIMNKSTFLHLKELSPFR